MNAKKANGLFLVLVLLFAGAELLITFTPLRDILTANLFLNLIFSELVLLLPALLWLLFMRTRPVGFCRIRRVKPGTVLMTVLFTLLCDPLITLFNAVSLLFVDNTVLGFLPSMSALPFPVLFFAMAVFGPFVEEFVFRGILYHSYAGEGNLIAAGILTAVLFGCQHMNFNQAAYAIIMGALAVLLLEASGSMLMTFVFHMLLNAGSVIMVRLLLFMPGETLEAAMETAGKTSAADILLTISMYLFLAVVCTPLAMCVLYWIAGHEDRRNELRAMWDSRKQKVKLITIPLAAAVLVCLGMMVMELV